MGLSGLISFWGLGSGPTDFTSAAPLERNMDLLKSRLQQDRLVAETPSAVARRIKGGSINHCYLSFPLPPNVTLCTP